MLACAKAQLFFDVRQSLGLITALMIASLWFLTIAAVDEVNLFVICLNMRLSILEKRTTPSLLLPLEITL